LQGGREKDKGCEERERRERERKSVLGLNCALYFIQLLFRKGTMLAVLLTTKLYSLQSPVQE
jgi:hypothetical protein